METCEWGWEGGGEYYETSCGNGFMFLDGSGPLVGGFEFCPYCGHKIVLLDSDWTQRPEFAEPETD